MRIYLILLCLFGVVFYGTAQQEPTKEEIAQMEQFYIAKEAPTTTVHYQQPIKPTYSAYYQYADNKTPQTPKLGQIAEYGLLGVLSIGILAILRMSVKADKDNSQNTEKAINKMAEAVAQFKTFSENMLQEHRRTHEGIKDDLGDIKSGIENLNLRIEQLSPS